MGDHIQTPATADHHTFMDWHFVLKPLGGSSPLAAVQDVFQILDL